MGALENKVAIITGAGRGQGAAMARRFVAEGARVFVTDIDGASAEHVARALDRRAVALQHDISDERGWDAVIAAALDVFGSVNVLVNNAGILLHGRLEETTRSDLERALQVNVVGAFLGMQAVFDPMKRAGGGSIINIASGAGMKGMPGMLAYATSKWALRGMSRSAALDFAKDEIRVNTICPGVIDTPMIREGAPPGFFERISTDIPLGRAGMPDDIASVAAFLASDGSAFMTGTDLVADGGRLA